MAIFCISQQQVLLRYFELLNNTSITVRNITDFITLYIIILNLYTLQKQRALGNAFLSSLNMAAYFEMFMTLSRQVQQNGWAYTPDMQMPITLNWDTSELPSSLSFFFFLPLILNLCYIMNTQLSIYDLEFLSTHETNLHK